MLNKTINYIKTFFVTLPMTFHGKVNYAVQTNNLKLLKKTFKNCQYTYSCKDFFFDCLTNAKHPEILDFLISETNVDPNFHNNFLTKKLLREQRIDMIEILWQSEEFKTSLKIDCPKIYSQLKRYEIKKNICKF